MSAPKAKGPVAFISSFYTTASSEKYWESPLWQLRQELAELNQDSGFHKTLPVETTRPVTWVAEKFEPDLGRAMLTDKDRFAVVDRLVEVLVQSDLYVCILAGNRRGERDHGSAVLLHGTATAVSYFEIELYAAAMHEKPIYLFVMEGFSPGPRLEALLQLLHFPNWCDLKPRTPKQILAAIKMLVREDLFGKPQRAALSRKRIVRQLYRAREDSELLFLDGQFEPRKLPQKDLVEKLIQDYRSMPQFQRKLNRLWIAARELMAAPYTPTQVQADSRLKAFLPLWDTVLGDWAGAASWYGWHGHLYAGTVAPLHSQALIRAGLQAGRTTARNQDWRPDGALASAYYSIAKVMGFSQDSRKCLNRAGEHIQRAIDVHGSATDGTLAIRGMIRLRLGHAFDAVDDFREMLRLREGGSALEIADAKMHLGEGYLFLPGKLREGRDLLRESVGTYAGYPDNPNLPRARRKLARAYLLNRQIGLYRRTKAGAARDALRIGALDQIRE